MCSTSMQLSVLVWSFLFYVKMFSFLSGSVCSTYRSFFLKPHQCNISLYLLSFASSISNSSFLPSFLLVCLHFFFLFLNRHFQFLPFSLALVTFSFKFLLLSGISRVIPLHLYTMEGLSSTTCFKFSP